MSKAILITGATSGFGKACAEIFAQHHHNLILTGRRADRLQTISNSLQQLHGIKVLPLVFDIQDKKACSNAIDTLPEEWKSIDILINNAGLALGRNLFDEASIEDWDTMIDTNIKGLLSTRAKLNYKIIVLNMWEENLYTYKSQTRQKQS